MAWKRQIESRLLMIQNSIDLAQSPLAVQANLDAGLTDNSSGAAGWGP